MNNYRATVRRAAERRAGDPIYNGSLDHAAVLAETLISFSNDHVDILTGSLNADVYGTSSLIESMNKLLSEPGRRVRVLIEDTARIDAGKHPFVKEFSHSTDVEFRELPTELASKIPHHFIEMDGDSYRFEKDKNLPEAVGAFGDEVGASRLHNIFETAWAASTKVIW